MKTKNYDSIKGTALSIGAKVRKLRQDAGYSSGEVFAIQHGLNRTSYQSVERGKANPTLHTLIRILNIHNIALPDFFANLNTPVNGKDY